MVQKPASQLTSPREGVPQNASCQNYTTTIKALALLESLLGNRLDLPRRSSGSMRADGAVSEFDEAMTVAKLKGARDRVPRQRGKCEGRKSYAEREGGADLVAIARQLHTNPNGRSPSLRTVAAALAAQGFVTPSERPYP